MWGAGRETSISRGDKFTSPHSLGLFFLASTQYLGSPYCGDEYEVMGLAPYREPERMDETHSIVRLKLEGRRLGPAGGKDEPITDRDKAIAASTQGTYEEAVLGAFVRVPRGTTEKEASLGAET